MSGSERVIETLIPLEHISNQGLTAIDQAPDGVPIALLVYRDAAQISVWLNACPHAGRRLDWSPGKFLFDQGRLVCAAHGAMIDLPTGRCVDGPGRGAGLQPCAAQRVGDHLRVRVRLSD